MFAPRSGRYLAVGFGIVPIAGAIALALHALLWLIPVAFLLAFVVFLAVFFRDPDRVPGPGIVSAADGRVLAVSREGPRWRIAVFLSVTDVHVNRVPIDGVLRSTRASGEGYRPAYAPDARHNRQRSYVIDTELGEVEIVQMTGIVARRLVSFVSVGDRLTKGARFGMIVLGSRVDVLLPAGRVRPTVRVGDRVRGGLSPIAEELG